MAERPSLAEVSAAYRDLELAQDTTLAQVKAQHRILAHVWHPDRLPEHLRGAGTAKLQQVNSAVDVLKRHLSADDAVDDEHRKSAETERKRRKAAKAKAVTALAELLTDRRADNFVIIDLDSVRNYYTQFAIQRNSPRVYGELPSNEFLADEDKLDESSQDELLHRGWRLNALADGGNYYKQWIIGDDGITERTIAAEVLNALKDVYGVIALGPLDDQQNLE